MKIWRHISLILLSSVFPLHPCSEVEIRFSISSATADPMYWFPGEDNAIGYINRNGKVIIPPRRDLDGADFENGRVKVNAPGAVYLDMNGDVAIQRDDIAWSGEFREGLAVAQEKSSGLWGYIGTNGEFAIEPKFRGGDLRQFSDGLAAVRVDGKWGFIDKGGNWAIEPRFDHAGDFLAGMSAVVRHGPCMYFPDEGCGPRFVGKPPFSGSIADAGLCEFELISRRGDLVGDRRFLRARPIGEGLAKVQLDDGERRVINRLGEFAFDGVFQEVGEFSEGLVPVRKGEKYGYVNTHGRFVLAPTFEVAESFSDGLAVVAIASERGGGFIYIDKEGTHAVPGVFDAAGPFHHGLAIVILRNSETHAYIDKSGKRILTFEP